MAKVQESTRHKCYRRSYSEDEGKKFLNIDLLSATIKNKLEKVKQYLEKGADINVIDANNNNNNTPLHYTVKNNNEEIVKLLLQRGAKVNIRNDKGETPLNLAGVNQNLIQILIKSTNAPADGNCVFWAVTLAYSTPVKDNDNLFQERFKKLFSQEKLEDLQSVKDSVKN